MKKPIAELLKIDPSNLKAYSSGLLQGKAYRALNTSLTKVLFLYSLSIPEWKLLGQLHDHGTMKLAEIAERLNVEPPLVTALIDKLEKKELVRRESHLQDKRAKIISITASGTQLLNDIEPRIKQVMGKLLQGITLSELRTYIHVLETIVNNANS